ncbi:MAG: tetratricopeptide repeat protein, partial [Anaerolineales bacterium]|nr:tetratricopeptide repeat protein [Anaerolineales bacterium]
ALASYRESLAIRKRLAEADPSNAGWQRDLSYCLTRLAELYKRQGERLKALPLAEESLSIDERLSALDPTNVQWRKDVEASRALVARLRGAE